MGFFKKIFGDAADEIKKSLEDSRYEKRNSLDDDDDEPRIILGKFSNGVLDIRDDIEELDDESLEGYKNVIRIIFPRGLKKLDSCVICDQDKLEGLDFSFVTELREIPDDFISGTTKIKEFVVPQGVMKIGDGFVGECKPGTKIVIPSTVEKMGYINGECKNDLLVYLFSPKVKIKDAEEDIKTLYVLPKYYGYYAKQLKECDSEARLREIPEDMMNIYANSFATEFSKASVEKLDRKPKEKGEVKEETTASTPLDDLVNKIKEQIQSLGLSSFILYASDYEGDRDYEEVEQLGDDGLLDASSEYNLYTYDEEDGCTSVYGKLRRINIVDDNVSFDIEEEYEDPNGDIEIRGKYDNQTISKILRDWDNDAVESGLTNVLKHYLTDKTLIELNGGSEKKDVIIEPTPEPIPEPTPKPAPAPAQELRPKNNVGIRTSIPAVKPAVKETSYTIRDLKRKKIDDLRKVRDEKNVNRTPEIVTKWKQLAMDIQTIDDAVKGGAKTLEELRIAVSNNDSLVSEIDEMIGVVTPEPAPSAFSGLFSPRMEALINSALQDGVLTEQEKAVLKKRAEKDGEDWDEVEMIINSRLKEIQKIKGIQISEPHDVQENRKKTMELKDIERAHLFLSFKSCEGADYAFLFLIDNNQLYATDENLDTPEVPSCDYFEDLDDYECLIENISDEYQSFKQLSESLVNDFVEARLDEFEGDTSALAIDSKYTVTVIVDKEKVYEETITC